MTRKLIIIAAAVAFAVTGSTAGAALAATPPAARPPVPAQLGCVTVTFGWQTQTGHEANTPVTVCGAGLDHNLQCELNGPGLAPGEIADCVALRRG